MGVAAEVLKYLGRATEGSFSVNHPLGLGCWCKVFGKGSRIIQWFKLRMELELAVGKRFAQSLQEQAAEEPGENSDGQEETRTASDPALTVWRDPATRHHAVHVRMVHEVLSPGVEDREKADLGTQVGRVSGDGGERFGAGAKENLVEHLLVLQGNGSDWLWQRKDHMEVWRVE